MKPSELPHVLIEPPKGWPSLELASLWRYREVIFLLVWRDIKVRYKQTVIGSAWAVLQPLITMAIFTVLFGRLLKVDTGDIPYPVFAYSALVPWTFFSHAMTKLTISLVADYDLVTRVNFPKLVIPVSVVSAAFVDLLLAFMMLILLMLAFGVVPGPAILAIPFFMLMAIATALAMGLWLSAINLKYRDIGHALPFVLQIWLFLTPVAYPSDLIPEQWRILYSLNPMTGVVEGFRWALAGETWEVPIAVLATSVCVVAAILVGGLYFFRRQEPTFAEVA